MKDLRTLDAACRAVVVDPALAPQKDGHGRIITTHCNEGAQAVANAMGCRELDGLMADQQYAVMAAKWRKATGTEAVAHAMDGGLAFAAMTSAQLGEAHGHIAAVCPTPTQWSASFGRRVPVVANVGAGNAEERESLAFPVAKGEPDYFAWEG